MPRMAGVMLKQESGGREHWQRQSSMMRRNVMPIDFWMDCLRWTNDSLPDMLLHFQNTNIGCVWVCSMQEHCIQWEESRTCDELGMMVLFILLE